MAVSDSLESVGTDDAAPIPASNFAVPLPPHWKRRLAPVAGFFGAQVIVQLLTFATGILIVRTMSKGEYALYNIANTLQGTIAILADSGSNSALTAIGGVVWQDKRRFGELIQTALGFRRRFGVAAGVVVGPILFWMIRQQDASVGYALLLSLTVLTASGISLTHGVLVTVPRLHTRIKQLQNADLLMAAMRLFLIGCACFLGLNALIAVAILVVTLAIQNQVYRRYAAQDADLSAPENESDRRTIWKLVRQQAANGIYYCCQGSLTTALVATFGQSSTVADLGALGRIALILTVLSSVINNLLIPRFARCHDKQRLLSMYKKIVASYIVLVSLFIALGTLFPAPLLLLLGAKYANLQAELPYILFAAGASTIAGILFSLNAARGWLQGGWLIIPITLITQAVLLPFLDLSTLQGAVLLTSLPILPSALPYIYRACREFQKMASE